MRKYRSAEDNDFHHCLPRWYRLSLQKAYAVFGFSLSCPFKPAYLAILNTGTDGDPFAGYFC